MVSLYALTLVRNRGIFQVLSYLVRSVTTVSTVQNDIGFDRVTTKTVVELRLLWFV